MSLCYTQSSSQPPSFGRRGFLLSLALAASGAQAVEASSEKPPVLVGLDGEFGLANSTSAQAVELGMQLAIAEINAAGGVLNGRPLKVVIKDHRSMPARGIRNIEEFAAMPDLVAVFGGRFSPVVIEELPVLKQTHLLFMAVWSSADAIVENGMQPNFIFRLSLRDSLAMPRMLQSAQRRGFRQVGLLLTNTSWGRSNLAAAEKALVQMPQLKVTRTAWYNWQDKSLIDKYRMLLESGAQAILLVANDDEAAVLMREMAVLAPPMRLPVISHWGITGGEFVKLAGPALNDVDLTVIQTFSFFRADKEALARFMQTARRVAGIHRIEDIQAPVGVAHAYDMMHILALAIGIAGSTDRPAVRAALEKVPFYRGLIKTYRPPFSASRHEALGTDQLLMARYRADGVLVPTEL